MKARILIVGTTAVALIIAFASISWAGRTGDRQKRQRGRITRGLKNGATNGKEFARLDRGQHRIQGAKKPAWSDGHFSRGEKRHPSRTQDKASKDIYRAKHNSKVIHDHRAQRRHHNDRKHYNGDKHHHGRSDYWHKRQSYRYHKKFKSQGYRPHHHHSRHEPYYGYYGSSINVMLSQPGWLFGWTIDFN